MLAALLAWNVWLTVRIYKYTTVGTDNRTVIQNTVDGYTTDITKVVENARTSFVSITQGIRSNSGVVIAYEKDTAYIMTSSQGLQANASVSVLFENTLSAEGTVVGSDAGTGLTLIKTVPGFEVKAIKQGDSSLVNAGEIVVAMGGRRDGDSAMVSSGTLSSPVQMGAVSDSIWISNLLEADVTVGENNIGGGMLNLSGELIGVIIPKPVNGQMDMGYAVSVNEMKNVYNDLKNTGSVTRANLGIIGRSVSKMNAYEKSANNISLDQTSGVCVSGVQKESCVDGFILQGDLLSAVDGKSLLNEDELHTILYGHAAGDTMILTIVRSGTEQQVSVILK